MLERLGEYSSQSLAVLRIVSGLLFVHAGMVILFNVPASIYDIPQTALMKTAGILEHAGGLLILAGFLTRPTAFILSGFMAVAYWGFHFPSNPWPANNMGAGAILYCFIFLHLVFAGPGAWSIDGRRG
jgi:putative oxidoreductase